MTTVKLQVVRTIERERTVRQISELQIEACISMLKGLWCRMEKLDNNMVRLIIYEQFTNKRKTANERI
jgi:hypothetical protein